MSQHTPPNDAFEEGTAAQSQNSPKKRQLEDSSAEFLEKGWRLVENVTLKKEHSIGNIKETRIGDTDGKIKIEKRRKGKLKCYVEDSFFKMINDKVFDQLLAVVNQSLSNSMTCYYFLCTK